ncbi:MAG TPA: 3-deoxy-7-phosphoheptulonate synthase [Atribacteraceae bacterium]|nr:3-deoxy-7-phosphoheptulonate synthase [Atribacteraceae bacterium]
MIVVFRNKYDQSGKEAILQRASSLHLLPCWIDLDSTLLVTEKPVPRPEEIFQEPVARIIDVPTPYQLAHRSFRPEGSVVQVGGVEIGRDNLVVIAGPCAVESRDQLFRIAETVKRSGAHLLRGGAFKPRTSPYSFQGLGESGLEILAQAREAFAIPVVTEATSPENAAIVARYADCIQIGARNMQNFELLKAVGRLGKPVLLKRGLSATIEDLLLAAEYVLSLGNFSVILCERGIRTIERLTRNTLDLTAISVVQDLSHLPVVVDPSHGTGLREKVIPMARAAVACGAHGVMVEVHSEPDKALSDGPQSLYPEQFRRLINDLAVIGVLVGKELRREAWPQRNLPAGEASGTPVQPLRVAHLGNPGSFSSLVARRTFGKDVEFKPCQTFREVFERVKDRSVSLGLVPLENTITGSIHANFDLLLEYPDLFIVGERFVRVAQHLGVYPGTRTEALQIIFAHPQGFAQCGRFLESRQEVRIMNVGNTEEAARRAGEYGVGGGCIAGEEAIAKYRLELVAEEIEDNPRNFTRFILLSPFFTPSIDEEKVSGVFSVANRPGALFEVLQVFARYEVNLLKLESRPFPGKPWEYLFYADWEGNLVEERFKVMLTELGQTTAFIRILGSYRNLWKKTC